jgi:hypothetical protein
MNELNTQMTTCSKTLAVVLLWMKLNHYYGDMRKKEMELQLTKDNDI